MLTTVYFIVLFEINCLTFHDFIADFFENNGADLTLSLLNKAQYTWDCVEFLFHCWIKHNIHGGMSHHATPTAVKLTVLIGSAIPPLHPPRTTPPLHPPRTTPPLHPPRTVSRLTGNNGKNRISTIPGHCLQQASILRLCYHVFEVRAGGPTQ